MTGPASPAAVELAGLLPDTLCRYRAGGPLTFAAATYANKAVERGWTVRQLAAEMLRSAASINPSGLALYRLKRASQRKPPT